MHKLWVVATLLSIAIFSSAYADDLSYLYGYVKEPRAETTTNEKNHAGIWQVDYRLYFNNYLALSVAYLNEGHIVDRKRDSVAPQLWLNLPLFNNHLAFSLGGGINRYYDTICCSEIKGSKNKQGWGQIYSLAATYNFNAPLFLRVTANKTIATHSTNSILFGAGVRLWDISTINSWPFYLPISEIIAKNELTAFFGETIHNSCDDLRGNSFGLEYRRNIFKYMDWTLTWLYQNDPGALKRNGVGTQVWAVHDYLDRHFTAGIGVGVYAFHDHEHNINCNTTGNDNLGELVSAMLRYRFTDHWNIKFIWNRVGTAYDHNTDDFLFGLGYTW